MKKTHLFVLLAFAVTIAFSLYAAEKTVSLEGTLVDSKCYLKDNTLTGNDHGPMKECGTMCLKGGTPGGLLTKNKQYHAIITSCIIHCTRRSLDFRVGACWKRLASASRTIIRARNNRDLSALIVRPNASAASVVLKSARSRKTNTTQ